MTTVQTAFWVVALLVVLAVSFDFMNGFHDAANSIATVVSTGVLRPQQAVHLRGDAVGVAFGRAHLVGVLGTQQGVGVVLDQPAEGTCAFDDVVAVLVEQIEEVALARHQLAEQHQRSPRMVVWMMRCAQV